MDILAEIAEERRAAASLLESLNADQLRTPSLCAGWTVADVAAHLLMPLVTPVPKVILALATSGFDFNRANLKLTAKVARLSPGDIAAGLRSRADRGFKPPGLGFEAPLNDLLVHQQDIRRPLGLHHELDRDRLRVCLDYVTGGVGRRVVPEAALDGLRYEASDLDWSFGAGRLVRGKGEALLLALCGRDVVLDELDGDGLDALRGALDLHRAPPSSP